MSTQDVPGSNPSNCDALKMGCWAEHKDGSLIFIKSVENGTVIYEMFDLSQKDVTQYTDAMPLEGFNKQFSYSPTKNPTDLWTWHDKTPMPWSRVIKAGARDGVQYACAADQLAAAARVAQSLGLVQKPFDPGTVAHMVEQIGPKAYNILERIQNAIDTLPIDKVAGEVKAGIEELKAMK